MLPAEIGGEDLTTSTPDDRTAVEELAGFEVRGRIGRLGIVAFSESRGVVPEVGASILVIGGRSSLLHFHIPLERVTSISTRTRSLTVDVDVVDFTPRVGGDGTVELHLSG